MLIRKNGEFFFFFIITIEVVLNVGLQFFVQSLKFC